MAMAVTNKVNISAEQSRILQAGTSVFLRVANKFNPKEGSAIGDAFKNIKTYFISIKTVWYKDSRIDESSLRRCGCDIRFIKENKESAGGLQDAFETPFTSSPRDTDWPQIDDTIDALIACIDGIQVADGNVAVADLLQQVQEAASQNEEPENMDAGLSKTQAPGNSKSGDDKGVRSAISSLKSFFTKIFDKIRENKTSPSAIAMYVGILLTIILSVAFII